MPAIEFTARELSLIARALHACSPSGGGSATYTLARKLHEQHGVAYFQPEEILQLQEIAHREFLGDDEIIRIEALENARGLATLNHRNGL